MAKLLLHCKNFKPNSMDHQLCFVTTERTRIKWLIKAFSVYLPSVPPSSESFLKFTCSNIYKLSAGFMHTSSYSAKRNYYDVLGVTPKATNAQVNNSILTLVLIYFYYINYIIKLK